MQTINVHRDSVLWYLGRKLQGAGELQRGMMERRLEREVEKGRSVLYKVRGGVGVGVGVGGVEGLDAAVICDGKGGMNGGHAGAGLGPGSSSGNRGGGAPAEDESRTEIDQQLSADQLQLFARENQDMLKQYEDTLDQVRCVPLPPFLLLLRFGSGSDASFYFTGQQSGQCWRYPNCKPHLFKISMYKAPIYHSL